jgi:hypothetical protein
LGGLGAAADNDQAISFSEQWRQDRCWMFGRIFGLDGRESYRELRLEPLCCHVVLTV